MAYKVVLTEDAEEDFDRFVRYLLFVKKSQQAAKNLLQDFEETKKSLENVLFTPRIINGKTELII